MSQQTDRIEAAREAVRLACAVTRQVQRVLDEVRAITKDDKSPVTVADYASQAIVGQVLRERLGPGVILVAEEASAFLRDDDNRAHRDATLAAVREVLPELDADTMLEAIDIGAGDTHHGGFWTLDPVDGTKGFLRNQQYAIALAYVERSEPTIGVMGCPNLSADFATSFDDPDPRGCVYVAVRGGGVWQYSADGDESEGTRITRLDHAAGEPICVCASVETAHTNMSDTDRILQHLEAQGERAGEPARLDSQAKYAVTARGQADAYLRLPTRKGYVERIWDHAAGAVVATEAGCFVTDIQGRALDFSHGRGLERNRGIVCAPPRVHGLMLGAIEALGIGAE